MPPKDCVAAADGRAYCWNDETQQIEAYTFTRDIVPVEKCPPDVICRLMHLLKNKKRGKGEGNA